MSISVRVASGALVVALLAVLIVTQTRTSSAQAPPETAVMFTFPHLVERVGRTTNVDQTFDTTIYMTHTDGLPGDGPTVSHNVDIYLFDDNGDGPLLSATGLAVCNPCSSVLSGNDRSRQFVLDTKIEAKGGFPRNTVNLWAFVTSTSPNTAVQAFITNSHSGPNDVSVTSVDPVVRANAVD